MKLKARAFIEANKTFFSEGESRTLRSSLPEVFCKKDIFENFAKLTGKHLC